MVGVDVDQYKGFSKGEKDLYKEVSSIKHHERRTLQMEETKK